MDVAAVSTPWTDTHQRHIVANNLAALVAEFVTDLPTRQTAVHRQLSTDEAERYVRDHAAQAEQTTVDGAVLAERLALWFLADDYRRIRHDG